MRNTLLLITFLILGAAVVSGQTFEESAAYEKQFINDDQVRPNPQVQMIFRNSPKWQKFENKYGDWWVVFNERTGLPKLAAGLPISIVGVSKRDAVLNFIEDALKDFELPISELRYKRTYEAGKYTYVIFDQVHNNKKVLWSEAKFQLNSNDELVHFKLNLYPHIENVTGGDVPEAALQQYATKGLESLEIKSIETSPGSFILPHINNSGEYQYSVVKELNVLTSGEVMAPSKFNTLVDVNTGEVLYRQDEFHSCAPSAADVTIEDSIVFNVVDGGATAKYPHMKVEINGDTLYTDSDGMLNLPDLTQPTLAHFYLSGKYAKVVDAVKDTTTIIPDTIYPGVNNISLLGDAKLTELNAYFHTNVIYQHMRENLPSGFDVFDFPFTVNVDIGTGSCNAFFDGQSINFFQSGGGCPPSSLFADVVYHEYGHGINYFYYDFLGGDFSNGALGEGYSDIWAFSVTEDPIIGNGFLGGASSFIRRYDQDRKVYPEDLTGTSIHADGEIIAGAFWDLYLNLGDIDHMLDLFVGGHNSTPDAPRGAEGELFSEILLQVLFTDDDDGNIANGTPNDSSILDAFGKHGIVLLANADIEHEPMSFTQDTVGNIISVSVNTSLTTYIGDVLMYYRNIDEEVWIEVAMDDQGASIYNANLPEFSKGDIIEYYFAIEDIFSFRSTTQPEKVDQMGDANLPYFLMMGYEEYYTEDFDNDFGPWTIDPDGDDDASTGEWVIESPNPSFSGSIIVQTGTDKTTEGNPFNLCAFTGNAASTAGVGQNDVDDGKTTLLSPPFDVSNIKKPAISYWRWFVNDPPTGANPGNDPWQVFISSDLKTWTRVERTFISDVSWRQNVIRVSDYVEPTETVILKFIAQDSLIPGLPFDGGSIVEAAVDDVQVFGLGEENQSTGFKDLESSIQLYPSPASNLINIYAEETEIESVAIFNAAGKIVFDEFYNDKGPIHIPSTSFSDGIYMVQIKAKDGVATRKVMIQH